MTVSGVNAAFFEKTGTAREPFEEILDPASGVVEKRKYERE